MQEVRWRDFCDQRRSARTASWGATGRKTNSSDHWGWSVQDFVYVLPE